MSFPVAAREALADPQLRRNLAKATTTIRDKRERVVSELPDWAELRAAGRQIKDRTLHDLPAQLELLERSVSAAGGTVHWARDADEANRVIGDLVAATGERRAVKVKSIATDEIKLNEALAARGIEALETDLAELIIQLGDDVQSHILVPAIHRNRAEIRDLFRRELGNPDLSDDPPELTEAARLHLRELFLHSSVGISGANFAIAETGSVCVVESEGNGRMCTTLPKTLITVMGIEKLLPSWRDLEVFLQLLPRSSTGERMNPYTSIWTGVREGDGPEEFHLVVIDAGRTRTLADRVGRQALRCIRCSACLNSCPVYSRVGGHAYESVYPGPIGAILSPQLGGLEDSETLPWASSLCGACYEVCPVEIDIPTVLVHLRGEIVDRKRDEGGAELAAMRALAATFSSKRRYEAAQKLGRLGSRPLAGRGAITHLPGALSGWTQSRDLRPPAQQTFREWWRRRSTGAAAETEPAPKPAVARAGGGSRAPAVAADPAPPGRGIGQPGEPEDPRECVLERIRSALGPDPGAAPAVERGYRTATELSREQVVELFCERATDYSATVKRVSGEEIAAEIAAALGRHEASRIGVPAALPADWRPAGADIELVDGAGLGPLELDGLDGALTGSAGAIAETGTILLDGGELSGRRALTLVPDLHVCVVEADRIAAGVPEGMAAVAGAPLDGRPVTLVSGPSATSDIELSRVEGVHGPRRLEILIVS